MSGFLPDLANWALRGGAGGGEDSNNNNDAENNNNNNQEPSAPAPALTEDDMRARRLARMEAMMARQQEQAAAAAAAAANEPQPMEVDAPASVKKEPPASSAAPMETQTSSPPRKKAAPSPPRQTPQPSNSQQQQQKKKAKETHASPADVDRKLQRKKELLLKKVLHVGLLGTHTDSDNAVVLIDLDGSTQIGVSTIAELLATRLSLSPGSKLLQTSPSQKPLLQYLAQAHRLAGEENKNLQQSNNKKDATTTTELQAMLQEIQNQVVSYAASSLMEPDLFELAKDGTTQLARCLYNNADPTGSITFGVAGSSNSFWYCLCEELITQDKAAFDNVIGEIVAFFILRIAKCESIDGGDGESNPVGIVSALSSMCIHKKAAVSITEVDAFLLPAPDSPQANELTRPPLPAGADLLRMLSGENRPYKKRSGPALEKDTLLGVCLRVATPKSNPAFSPSSILRQSSDSVERATSSQRQQLRVYQDACNHLVMGLVKAGPDARGKVMKWFSDCMMVNTGASALRPDPTKVSCSNLMLNASVVLLKLCDPIVNDEKKHKLIDPGFLTSQEDHLGVFATTGDDAVSRLGEAVASTTPYTPKNAFVPQCFFLCARSLNLSIVPLLSYHENLLRHISHTHWEINSQNRDIQSDPHFCILVSKQRSNEVALFQEEYIDDNMRFCNLLAKRLFEVPDDLLSQMPEHFVDNICDILMSVAKMKPKLLRGLELRHVFKMVVKLLSPTYASMVRNYNLRAMLGDVLYELYLPSGKDDRREVPTSIACDPMAGGQTFLLSDAIAQETLAPSLLLLYGEVEHTGYYDKMSHRAKISSLLKYLWESSEHRPAFRSITQNKESFIKFANGIMNETNTLIATVMQKLPEIRGTQEKMASPQEWGRLSEDEQGVSTSRLEDNEREVKHALPLCNKTLQMFGYLNTDKDIRSLFLLDELCPRLVTMLLHVLTKLVGSKGLDLKVNNPEQYEFRPKEMLRDLCAIFALFASAEVFQIECAKSGCNPDLLRSAVKTCKRLNLLTGESMIAFETLPDSVDEASRAVADDEALIIDAPDEFHDEILSTFMTNPVILPSGHYVDRSTITQHLLNDSIDPFNREAMTIDDVKPATELKARMDTWLAEKRAARLVENSS